MAKARGLIYEASEWFKDTFIVNDKQPEAWSLIGNLHMSKEEWLPAQKKFEQILEHDRNDSYSLLSMGNIYYAAKFEKKDKVWAPRPVTIHRRIATSSCRWISSGRSSRSTRGTLLLPGLTAQQHLRRKRDWDHIRGEGKPGGGQGLLHPSARGHGRHGGRVDQPGSRLRGPRAVRQRDQDGSTIGFRSQEFSTKTA